MVTIQAMIEEEVAVSAHPIDLIVIDDSDGDRDLIRFLLGAAADGRYKIREAPTAADGARLIRQQMPECVLLDCGLPDKNGVKLLSELAAAEDLKCPFILLSGNSDPRLSAKAFGVGAQDFLSKNELTPAILDRAIQHALARFHGARRQQKAIDAAAEWGNILRAAEEGSGIGTYYWDVETGATRFGGQYLGLYGRTPGDVPLSIEEWMERVHPGDRARVKAEFERSLDLGAEFSSIFRVVWPDATVHWLMSRGAVSIDAVTGGRRMTGINVDISETKATEEALLSSNSELQEFAFMAGHDLQAPLRTVSVFTELLDRTFASHPDVRIRQAIQEVMRGSERMRSLIDDLLQFAQAGHESEHVVVRKPLQYALDLALANLRFDIEASGARIATEGLETVCSFGNDLAHVFQNLIGNSIKYRRPGIAPEIRVSCAAAKDGYVIAVKDNGMGFGMKDADTIFQPFQRLMNQDIAGTGLGLPICKRLVERHGGKIWTESEPGVGSTFYFTLPATYRPKHGVN
ncbi:MAG: domain S-box [Bryobacterales bacterium]|nr:domain S-box [Bryobacterales bacterium]